MEGDSLYLENVSMKRKNVSCIVKEELEIISLQRTWGPSSDEDMLDRQLQVYERSESQEGSLRAGGQRLLHVQGGADWRCEIGIRAVCEGSWAETEGVSVASS